ncbi:zinc finger and BTB domain-containing protein 49 isoform X2 [Denticeps clupeoides]|nr:zinc finger and BTB domain-containing protein 49 isoform X2 [Denticeps clupeoides]
MDSLSGHSSYLLQQLQEQRIQGMLCDCMLVVKGVCFKAHKNVLAAFSSYFRSLFQNASSQKSDVFDLVIQDVGGIGQVLDYMYTSHLEVTQENVHALLHVAQCLQVPNVLSMCQTFLKPCTPAFPETGPLAHEQPCLLTSGLAPPMELHSVPLDPQRPRAAAVEMDVGPSPMKLRNFYSKQYLRQSEEQNQAPNTPMSSSTHIKAFDPTSYRSSLSQSADVSDCSSVLSQASNAITAADEQFPQGAFPAGTTTPAVGPPVPTLQAACGPQVKALHTKKAVYLKKFNYLRSQRVEEEMEAPQRQQREAALQSQPTEETEATSQPPLSPVAEEGGREPPAASGGKQYCCEVCGKTFKHPSNLELHKRSHTGEKPFQCNVCGKHFSQAGNLQTHLRRHSGEKPYICELCGKSFAASGDVQRHIIIHTGEKPHLCDICGRGFSNFSNLKEHKKTHSTEKEFTCDQCGKAFNIHRKLLKHKARHTGEKPYCCQTCGKSFAGSGDLRRHVRSHSGERPYFCETCGKSFTRSAVLRRHRGTHCRPTAVTSPSMDRKVLDQMNRAPPPHTVGQVKPLNASEPPFSLLLQHKAAKPLELSAEPPSDAQTNPNPSSALLELRQVLPGLLLSSQSAKCPPPDTQLPQETSFSPYPEEHSSTVPPARSPTDSGLYPYRGSEGPIFSSVALWGLAMKTLQSEGEMEH